MKVVDETFEKAEVLEAFSEMGNMLKDVNVSLIREIYVGNYKICYGYLNGQINILKIVDKGFPYGKL